MFNIIVKTLSIFKLISTKDRFIHTILIVKEWLLIPPIPNDEGEIENTWAIHQLYTTANFAPKNWLVNYYTGGLNHQIEHHIFPNISHVHYDKIAEFVKQTAKECNLPYHEFKTTREAILSHFTHLKNLGMKPELSA